MNNILNICSKLSLTDFSPSVCVCDDQNDGGCGGVFDEFERCGCTQTCDAMYSISRRVFCWSTVSSLVFQVLFFVIFVMCLYVVYTGDVAGKVLIILFYHINMLIFFSTQPHLILMILYG